jgi:ATP-dependent Clp protease ATP-binding subunit ClpA
VLCAFAASAALRDKLHQSKIEPLHLLAAIAGDESSRVGQILREARLTRNKIVEAIQGEPSAISRQRLEVELPTIAVGPAAYSKSASSADFLARQLARTRGSWNIEIEDLLLALLIEDQGDFMDAIAAFPGIGIDITQLPPPHQPFLPRTIADDLIGKIKALCSRAQPIPPGSDIRRSEGVKRAFAVADLLRGALQQESIEPLHLLAAILGTEPGTSSQMFLNAGVTPDQIIEALRGEKPADAE